MKRASNKSVFIQVAVDRYVDKLFDYSVPLDMVDSVKIGMRVLIDFRRKKIYGLVISKSNTTDVPSNKIKPILSVDKEILFFDKNMLKLGIWISQYYCAPLGMVLKNIIPTQIRTLKKKFLNCEQEGEEKLDSYLPPVPHHLNKDQLDALNEILNTINNREYNTFLLYGVTGSGKTEVYLRSIEHAKAKGKQAIVIVPEISLTPQMIEIFETRFDDVAVFHSRLTPKKRRLYWLGMKRGKYNVVIGARSAVFAPFENLGLIIVDEEHERTYKQGEIPFYNARDVAVMRGKMSGACVVLGSATPSLESYSNCEKGKYKLLELPFRVDKKELPKVEIIDMNHEIKKSKGKNAVFSAFLLEEIEKRIKIGEQCILFLNRRGYSTFVCCKKCGFVMKCEHCSIALTFHKSFSALKCHRCDYSTNLPKVCPECKDGEMKKAGTGTEKVEKQLKKIFPEADIARMDTDITKKKGSYEEILGNFRRGKIDVLVGTQMIAKGLDISNVTLVGIIAADIALNLPDFRAGEYTFQLITQVSGRAGRGALKGNVILQTFSPELPIINFAAKQDYIAFYKVEKEFRMELKYPPQQRFINICFRGENEVELARFVQNYCMKLKVILSSAGAGFKGPIPSPIKKINRFYRWNMIVMTKNILSIASILNRCAFQDDSGRNQVVVDVDPLSLL